MHSFFKLLMDFKASVVEGSCFLRTNVQKKCTNGSKDRRPRQTADGTYGKYDFLPKTNPTNKNGSLHGAIKHPQVMTYWSWGWNFKTKLLLNGSKTPPYPQKQSDITRKMRPKWQQRLYSSVCCRILSFSCFFLFCIWAKVHSKSRQ